MVECQALRFTECIKKNGLSMSKERQPATRKGIFLARAGCNCDFGLLRLPPGNRSKRGWRTALKLFQNCSYIFFVSLESEYNLVCVCSISRNTITNNRVVWNTRARNAHELPVSSSFVAVGSILHS